MRQFTGIEYLKMDIAVHYGHGNDKKDWDDRLEWFHQHEHELMELLPQAEEDAIYYGGVLAYKAYLKGKPSGFPIRLDATCSVIQILSCLAGDEKAAIISNAIGSTGLKDAYMEIYRDMVLGLGTTGTISRDKLKKPIMTSIYGSKRQPKSIFGEDSPEYNQFMLSAAEMLPLVWVLKDSLIKLWQPNVFSHDFTQCDGFEVHLPVKKRVSEPFHFKGMIYESTYIVNRPSDFEVSLAAHITHSTDALGVREIDRACMYKPAVMHRMIKLNSIVGTKSVKRKKDKQLMRLLDIQARTNFTSYRLVEFIDESNKAHVPKHVWDELIELVTICLEHKPFQILSVHDCFSCLPAYGNPMRKHYQMFLYRLAKSTLIQSIAREITGNNNLVFHRPDISSKVLTSEYPIC